MKNWILSHLIRLGKKETKLHQQILGADILLAAFGEAKGSQNISQFGNYTELLFNERGRMIGTKIESYLLDKARIAQPEKHNFHIFYYLLAGTSPQEKEALSLHSTQTYRYLTQNNNGLSHEQRLQGYQDFKNAMRWVGLGKNQQARVIQLLATLLNLGQLQFMDNPNVQEAAIIKNRDMLELVSDGLGVDAGTLENVLTYKTQLIKKDVTTLILNAEQSSLQRDEFAITLYSALFDWLVNYLNQKLNNENAHNFIGILDFPGTVSSSSSDEGYHRLSLNYCNERIQEYIQRYVFQVQGQEYGEDGLDYPAVSSDITHHLLEHDLMHLVQSYSKKITNSSANENEFIRAVNKNLSGRPSFQIFQSETGATLFSIQHFHGQQTYNPNLLLEESRITTGDSPDFVTLFKGSAGMSCNDFLSTLFDKPPIKSKGMRSALDSLFEKLDGTVPWVIYCLHSSHGSTFDSQLVHAQVVERDLVKTAIRLQTGSFLNVYTFDDFSERYSDVLTHFGIYKDTPKIQCETLVHLMNWKIKKEADIGSTKVKRKKEKKKIPSFNVQS